MNTKELSTIPRPAPPRGHKPKEALKNSLEDWADRLDAVAWNLNTSMMDKVIEEMRNYVR